MPELDEGTVHLPLVVYNAMRDELDQRRKVSLTHEEFLKKFRLSLANVIIKSEEQGLHLSEILKSFNNVSLDKVQEVEVSKEEDKWTLLLKDSE